MITHAVLFRWRPEVTETEVLAVAEHLRSAAARLPVVRGYRVGIDLGLREDNMQFGVVATFDDSDGLETYLTDPRHRSVIEEARPLIAERRAIQFEGE